MATLPTKESPFQPYTVPKVKLTDTSLGSGAYGSVEEAEITGARCAAKTINERAFPPDDPLEERKMKVAEGCRQWNNLRHPNVVQFLGVYFPELASPIPVLLMEAMSTNLHQFLKSRHRAGCIPLALKISILRDTACGVAYLHGQQPPIVHGRLSAKKVHLDSGMVAKILVDVGITILEQLDLSLYMPPEVTDKKSPRRETIDTFSIGVLAIFTTTEELPERILPTSYTEELKEQVAEHQVNYMEKVHSRFRRSHPLVQLIEKCLSMLPESRPTIEEILSLLWQAGAEIPDPFREKTKAQLAQEMAKQSQEILQIKGDFESHVSYLQSQIEGLFLGMAKQRKMLPCDEDEDSEEVTEQEIAYIVNFLEGIRASDLGVALRITVSSLDIIDFNFLDKHDENRKRVAVLTEWIRNCDSPTWPALIEALITIGQKRMADLINNDKGMHCATTADEGGTSNCAEQCEAVTKEEPRPVERNSVAPDSRRLDTQLVQAKKALEIAKSKLDESRRELDKVNERCESLEEEMTEKTKEIKYLKIELKAEVQLREETAKMNIQLQLELEQLKHQAMKKKSDQLKK